MIKLVRHAFAAAALAVLVPLGACHKAAENPASGARPSADTLAAAISGDAQLSKLAAALHGSGLASVFDGAGAYTLIAPRDAAFAGDTAKVTALLAPEHRAALVALLREHIVPGYLTPEDIGKAIDTAKGKAVKMRTMGSGTLAFTRSGNDIVVTAPGGYHAVLGSPALRASNGVAIPVDTLLHQL